MTIIPKPDERFPVMGAIHRSLSVAFNDATVIYTYDTIEISLYVRPHEFRTVSDDRRVRVDLSISATDLHEAMKHNWTLGYHALTVSQTSDYSDLLMQTSDYSDLLIQAIPHFYAATNDAEERKLIRAVYRRLAKLAVPA